MRRSRTVPTAFLLACCVTHGQPAEFEVDGIFGECIAIHAAATDGLVLHTEPDLRSEQIQIPYRRDWEIPYLKAQGMTRVLRIGAAKVVRPDTLDDCDAPSEGGSVSLVLGETVEYLTRLGEGRGQIRVRGSICRANLNQSFGAFEVIQEPQIQWWLRVLYGDGSSPGWLLHDDTQTRLAGVRC